MGGASVSSLPEMIQVGTLWVRFVVEPEESNGSVSVFECFVPAQAEMPAPHSHDVFEETIYGLEGISTWTVDGQVHQIGVGDALCVARGAVHGFDNRGALDAKFLAISSPGVMRPDYFRELGAVLSASAGSPPDRVKIGEVMRRYGLTPAPPRTA
jgi:quercetin dioxygenase-like cupin family protein